MSAAVAVMSQSDEGSKSQAGQHLARTACKMLLILVLGKGFCLSHRRRHYVLMHDLHLYVSFFFGAALHRSPWPSVYVYVFLYICTLMKCIILLALLAFNASGRAGPHGSGPSYAAKSAEFSILLSSNRRSCILGLHL